MWERRPVAVALAVLLSAASAAAPGCSSLAPAPQRLTVGLVDLPATGLFHVARHEGYFREAGVELRVIPFPTGRDALAALLDGRVDVATTFETPLVSRALQGDRPRILTTLHQSTRNTRVVVPEGRGIAGPEDLRGRRVGVVRGTNAEFFLETLIALTGLDPADVREVDVLPQDMAPMLARRQLDAVAIWYPWAVCGHPPLDKMQCIELFADGYTEYSLLVTRDEILKTRREGLTRMVRALARAERLVLDHPDAVLPALSAELPSQGGPHLRESWRRVTPQLGLDHLLVAVLEREADWFQQRMDAPTPSLDLRTLLAPEILLGIEPRAVTILADE